MFKSTKFCFSVKNCYFIIKNTSDVGHTGSVSTDASPQRQRGVVGFAPTTSPLKKAP